MSYTSKERMHEILKNILNVVQERIGKDLAQRKNIKLLLSANNYWQEQEHDGQNYIFNIDNVEDLKYLVDNGMITASGISWVMNQKSHFFKFEGKTDDGIKIISMDELIEILFANATDYMGYAIMYVGRCGEDSPYANIYDEYVTSYIEDYFK